MKVQVDLELNISAKASYRDGVISISTSGTMPLAAGQERTVTSSVEGASEKVMALFQKAFDTLLAEQQAQVINRTRIGASEALSAASRMGEL